MLGRTVSEWNYRRPGAVSWTSVLLVAAGCLGVAFLVVPLLLVLYVSFGDQDSVRFPVQSFSLRWYRNLLTDPRWYVPFQRSLLYGFWTALLSAALGAVSAYGWVHCRYRLRVVTVFVFLLPLLIPPLVIGVGQLLFFAKLGLVDTPLGLITSHVVLTFPLAFLVIVSTLKRWQIDLEDVACSLGAPRWYAFLQVTLPGLKRGILGAFLLSFVVSFDEAVVALFLTGFRTRTLPRQMFDGLRYDLDPTVAAVAGCMTMCWVIVTVLGWLTWRARRRPT